MAPPKEIQPREGLVFVCRKCMKREGAEELRGTLKKALGKGVRVARSSCLKVCPKGRVLVVVGNGERMRCLLADPRDDGEALAREVSRCL